MRWTVLAGVAVLGVAVSGSASAQTAMTDDPCAVLAERTGKLDAAGADALVLVTEWDEFRALDLRRLAGTMRSKHLIDLRNVYDPADVERAGLSYRGIGRGEQRG